MQIEVPHGIGLRDARAILAAWQSAGIEHVTGGYPAVLVRLADVQLVKHKFSGTGTPARMVRGKHALRSRRAKQAKGQTGARFVMRQRKEIE